MYNLDITLVGSYVAITDFIYDVENDEQLNFEIKNLSIQPYTTTTTITTSGSGVNKTEKTSPFKKITEITSSTLGTNNNSSNTNNSTQNNSNNSNTTTNNASTNNKTIIYDPEWVEVTFKVENIGITLD